MTVGTLCVEFTVGLTPIETRGAFFRKFWHQSRAVLQRHGLLNREQQHANSNHAVLVRYFPRQSTSRA